MKKLKNIKELYDLEVKDQTYSLEYLINYSYSHIPEINEDTPYLDLSVFMDGYKDEVKNKKVLSKVIKHHNFDHRYYWRLASVWYDGKPVMVVQNSGRHGESHKRRFITDMELYMEMVEYIQSIMKKEILKSTLDSVVDEDTVSIEALTSFSGNKLGGYFEYH